MSFSRGEVYIEPAFISIIGVPLLEKNCFTLEKIKLGNHDYPTDWNVDPKTQNRLWAHIYHFNFPNILKYDAHNPSDDICYFLKGRHGVANSVVYLGVIAQGRYEKAEYIPITLTNYEDIQNKLKFILEPEKIWTEKHFGLYSVVYSKADQEY